MTPIICGVDVSSASLQACIGRSGAAGNFANNPEGIAQLIAFCGAHQVDLAALEASGGMSQAFARLSEHGLPVAASTRAPYASSPRAWAR